MRELDVVLLDAGGTLISVDFDWIHRELTARSVICTLAELERAEAASRPAFSREAARRLERGEPPLGFPSYFGIWLDHLAAATGRGLDAASLAAELSPVLRPPGQSYGLWTRVLPGVERALGDLVELGVKLAVVSNSDGSAERSIAEAGLRPYFDLVVDSEIVGFEKPDPRIFTHAIERLGCDPARTLHVGDMYFADVVGARNAGLRAVLLDPWNDWHDADCARLPDVAAVRDAIRHARVGR